MNILFRRLGQFRKSPSEVCRVLKSSSDNCLPHKLNSIAVWEWGGTLMHFLERERERGERREEKVQKGFTQQVHFVITVELRYTPVYQYSM